MENETYTKEIQIGQRVRSENARETARVQEDEDDG